MTVSCLLPNSMTLSKNRCMRVDENEPCLFSSYSLFRVGCEVEIKLYGLQGKKLPGE